MEKQMNTMDRRQSRASTSHRREHAQIDGDNTAIGSGVGRPTTSIEFGPEVDGRGSHNTVSSAKDYGKMPGPLKRNSSFMDEPFPLLDLKEVPRSSTPKPTASELKRASIVGMNDENKKLGSANKQNRTSGHLGCRGPQPEASLKFKSLDENSSPLGTPGRLQRSGQGNSKTASFMSLKNLTPTPKQRGTARMSPGKMAEFGRNVTNESDRNLSRLSRPFDMDMSNENRPFDSDYPGTEQLYSFRGKAGRLSVAAPTGAGTPGYFGDDESGDTALPKIEDRGMNKESRKMTSSKRMVSNFLRSRRKNAPLQSHAATSSATTGSSFAFV
jgi:hypothetical protein